MLDLLLCNGDVIDGTGAPRRRADVGIRDGRVVAIGLVDEPATTVIDIAGLVVCPGFIDVHTHYDAQALWDPYCTPSPLHGVTTVLAGNCGFTIAPLGASSVDDADVDYVKRMMARVEGIPLPSLEAGPAWDWLSFGEFLDRLDGRLGVNAGFLVGHSTLRRIVMGDRATTDQATPEEVAAMVALAHDAMASGAIGFSSSLGEAHTDGNGDPVPSRASSHDELLALAASVREHEGTSLEFIAAMGVIPDARIELMTNMSLAGNRPLNWNLLGSLSPTPVYDEQLRSVDHARAHGANVVALALPDLMRMRSSRVINDMPGWRDVVQLDAAERRAAIARPEVRQALRDGVAEAERRGMGAITNFALVEIGEAPDEFAHLVGRSIHDIAIEQGVDDVEVLIDVVLPDLLPLTMVFPSLEPELGTSEEGWRKRAAVWNDDRVVLGGSDAGAHTDLLCHANYTTMVLGDAVRERNIFTLESAVQKLTDVPARLYGLRDRGQVRVGAHADLVVFDPATVGSTPARVRFDLPASGERLYAEAIGVAHVFVNGAEIVRGGEFTGTLPGVVLRSGTHTETVTVPGND